ncbi:MAG: CTB family bacteriocin [Chlorogloeopsis fritschii C42_A2020_084]|uniref:CTB family bacteriocin n=1 Tax=Chlorogloeopsis fritschii TaxID=1124 RepID=UPI0019F3ECED|nr:CTB family bacteriocin [Chlorogloeopsis fritschii]MBF2006974.1 CTB family bacteriocin [Chlorogloeopsis fritschii C42_A2020_084]
MEFKLFVELSDKQQELISGGGQLLNLDEFDYTDFEYQNVNLNKTIASGINGSFITKELSTNFVFTSAYEDLMLDFDPGAVGGNGNGNG